MHFFLFSKVFCTLYFGCLFRPIDWLVSLFVWLNFSCWTPTTGYPRQIVFVTHWGGFPSAIRTRRPKNEVRKDSKAPLDVGRHRRILLGGADCGLHVPLDGPRGRFLSHVKWRPGTIGGLFIRSYFQTHQFEEHLRLGTSRSAGSPGQFRLSHGPVFLHFRWGDRSFPWAQYGEWSPASLDRRLRRSGGESIRVAHFPP